jgi:glutamate 5-kinase
VRIGKGVANFSADELDRIRGRRTAEVREIIPEAPEEVVHRDHLVLD